MRVRKIVEMARRIKDSAFEADPHTARTVDQIVYERDGKLVAIAYRYQGDPKWTASAIRSGIVGFDAAEITVIADAYTLMHDDPEARFEWGEFQERWEAGQREGLSECMLCLNGKRGARRLTRVIVPYIHEPEGLVWDDERISTIDVHDQRRLGRMVRMIIEGYARPSALEAQPIDYREYGMSREEARINADCGQMRAMLFAGYHVVLAGGAGPRDEIIAGTLKHIEEEGVLDMDLLRETLVRYAAGEFL